MRAKISRLIFALTITLLLTAYVDTISASTPTPINGDITVISSGPPDLKFAGKSENAVVKFSINDGWTGSIEGVGTGLSTWNCHGIPQVTPGWSINIYEKIVFSDAKVQGQLGSLTMEVNLYSDVDGTSGHWTIIGGTDELANLHGQGTILQVAPYAYTYSGQVHFDP